MRSKEEIVRRGEELYEKSIRPKVEEDFDGKILAIAVKDSGDYEINNTSLRAADRLRLRQPRRRDLVPRDLCRCDIQFPRRCVEGVEAVIAGRVAGRYALAPLKMAIQNPWVCSRRFGSNMIAKARATQFVHCARQRQSRVGQRRPGAHDDGDHAGTSRRRGLRPSS